MMKFFTEPLPHFTLAKIQKLQVHVVLSGENGIVRHPPVRRQYFLFPLRCLIITCLVLRMRFKDFNAFCFVLRKGFFHANKRAYFLIQKSVGWTFDTIDRVWSYRLPKP